MKRHGRASICAAPRIVGVILLILIAGVLSTSVQNRAAAPISPAAAAPEGLEDRGVRIIGALDPASLETPAITGPEIWRDPSAPVAARVQDLLSRMSLAEKATQVRADAPAITRLGIPAYSYRNECLHGVMARFGVATVFPQAIGMAATWDPPLIQKEADVIATEGRAHFNDYTAHHDGNSVLHTGISFYAPNINIVRDPRWGRGQETYGEDPFLTGQMAVAYIHGLQGDNPKYFKAIAGAKHFDVHSGPEPLRRAFNANPPEQDLYDTYLPAFEAAVREGGAGSVMGSYNALYGIPACANPFLLTQVLRERWGFQGFVVSDGGAIQNIWKFHKYVPTPEQAAAVAVKAGCDLFSASIGGPPRADYEALGRMLQKGLLSEKDIDRALVSTYTARFRLGLFDPPGMAPWSKITLAQNDTDENRALALQVARESIVLLKNNGILPLNRSTIHRIAVIGSNANAGPMLLGNYHGRPSHIVTILDGIQQAAGPNVQVTYAPGAPLALKNDNSNRPTPAMTGEAMAAARSADLVIYVGGLNSTLEGEEHRVDFQGFLGGDRTRIELPSPQEDLLKALKKTGKSVVFVDCSGSAIAMPWEAKNLPAIVQAWYPGEEGGLAVAQALFGDFSPAGRLPITIYRSTADLPPFTDYSMADRTYRYFKGKPLFAFGHGLSYTTFRYTDLRLNTSTVASNGTVKFTFSLKNTGPRRGDEVAQVYERRVHSAAAQPRLTLCGFTRIPLTKGDDAVVAMKIPVERFRIWSTTQKRYVIEPGEYELLIGGASDAIRLRARFAVVPAPTDRGAPPA